MDKTTAARVSALLEAAIGKLSEAVEAAERSAPPDEYESLRRGGELVSLSGASPTRCSILSMSSSRT